MRIIHQTYALHIFAQNAPVHEYNIDRSEQIQSLQYILKALDQFPPHVRKQDIEKVLSKGRSKTGGLDTEIVIKENARVMLTTNVDISDRLINGQLGTVIRVTVDNTSNKPSTIFVKFDDCNAGASAIRKSSSSFARDNHAVPVQPVLVRIKVRPGKPSSPEIQRLQFPLTLAWACTFDLKRRKCFNFGQVYVALSRATSLKGLHILGTLESKHIRANPKVQEEYERLREISSFHKATDICHNESLSICILNIRSLQKHSRDLSSDPILSKCDVLTLTETQLLCNIPNDEMSLILKDFSLHRQDHAFDKFLSLAICYKETITLCETEYFSSINGLKFSINLSRENILSCLLLYRKHGVNIQQFISCLDYIIRSCNFDLIFGDFNIDYFNEKTISSLKELTESLNYVQLVNKPTFVSSGSLLDHVYVKQSMSSKIEANIVSVYYSDHEAFKNEKVKVETVQKILTVTSKLYSRKSSTQKRNNCHNVNNVDTISLIPGIQRCCNRPEWNFSNVLYGYFGLNKSKLKWSGTLEDLKAFVLTEISEEIAENTSWRSPSGGTWQFDSKMLSVTWHSKSENIYFKDDINADALELEMKLIRSSKMIKDILAKETKERKPSLVDLYRELLQEPECFPKSDIEKPEDTSTKEGNPVKASNRHLDFSNSIVHEAQSSKEETNTNLSTSANLHKEPMNLYRVPHSYIPLGDRNKNYNPEFEIGALKFKLESFAENVNSKFQALTKEVADIKENKVYSIIILENTVHELKKGKYDLIKANNDLREKNEVLHKKISDFNSTVQRLEDEKQ
ncbi:Hypothetical predicted protein, partial [Paramuricea clavata]